MTTPLPIDPLTTGQKNLCEYGGIFGVLLSLTCLIQHISVAIPSNITNPMIPVYLFAIIAFILLGLQKHFSWILLIVSAVFSLLVEWLWLTHYSFSLVVLLLFLYHAVIILFLFVEGIPKKLKHKSDAEKAERDLWEGKI